MAEFLSPAFADLRGRIPYAARLGIEFDSQDEVFHLPFRAELVGNRRLPAIHGGVIGGFMENAALIWLGMTEDQGRVPSPIDFAIDYLRSARARDCFARCEVLRQGRRVAQVQIRCWQRQEATPVAVARGHYLLQLTQKGATEAAP